MTTVLNPTERTVPPRPRIVFLALAAFVSLVALNRYEAALDVIAGAASTSK